MAKRPWSSSESIRENDLDGEGVNGSRQGGGGSSGELYVCAAFFLTLRVIHIMGVP